MKDAYWFSHDSNAKDDPKCVLLIEQLGLEGYGIYWVLVETLREQPNYKYPIILLSALARRFNTTTEKIKAVVLNYNLFILENNEFFLSESLIERMQKLDDRREIQRQNALKRWGDAKLLPSHSQSNAIKENKIKLKKNKVFIPPTIEEVKDYFKENSYSESTAIKMFNSYSVANWVDSKGNDVKNWKQKAINVWFKDENKIIKNATTYKPVDESKNAIR